ncbi:MAG: replication initiator protein A [Alphaproteobacteria bacterium]|nr:replication initiator protein A [Alphaproteobacteria bacterium]
MMIFITALFEKLLKNLGYERIQESNLDKEIAIINDVPSLELNEITKKYAQKKKKEIISYPIIPIRDVIDLMEFPFLALSKNRRNPIIYESSDGTKKIKITRHTGHFLASIYDWDIILVVAGKIQEILNNSSDVPSRKITIPRHELLKALHKQDGKKERKDLEKSLSRLQMTGINTTVNNKDYRHREGFGFIDSWGYLERKNNREIRTIRITLSDWLYELCCAQGSLLKSDSSYFALTSGLKRFLYRTARKHAGKNRDGWGFTIEELYEKSGSEQEFKKFKSDLKFILKRSKIPEYSMKLTEKNGKDFIIFKNSNIHELERRAEEFEKKQEKI